VTSVNKLTFLVEKKYFIDVVAKQVVERHLVAPLAEVFSSKLLAQYKDKEIHFLASKPPEIVRMREHLESRHKMLERVRSCSVWSLVRVSDGLLSNGELERTRGGICLTGFFLFQIHRNENPRYYGGRSLSNLYYVLQGK
jgi:hypothetical protein